MKKYLLLLLVIIGTLYTKQVQDLYTNQTKPIKITYNGTDYLSFDEHNTKILYSQIRMFSAMYLPPSNCTYSNMVSDAQIQSDIIEKQNLAKKIKDYTIIALATYVIIDVLKAIITPK